MGSDAWRVLLEVRRVLVVVGGGVFILKTPIKGVRQLKTAVLAKLEGLGMPRLSYEF